MEKILAFARKVADEAEVYAVTTEETHVQFEANRLKHIQSKQSTVVALRVIKDGKTGYAVGTEMDGGEKLASMAAETAGFGAKAWFAFPARSPYPLVETLDPGVDNTPVEVMAGLGEKMIGVVRGHTPDIICDAGITRATERVRIMNSRGGQADYRQSVFALGVEGQLVRGTDMLFVGESESSCHPLQDTGFITASVIQQLEWAKEIVPSVSGILPVIFTPHGVASALVAPFMAAFNGKMVLEGASPVGKKLGQKILDDSFSLIDDPLIPFQPGSRPCDDEGVPSQRTPLIERGVVAGFLYDLQTAGRAGARSTGSGSRGRGSLPSPSPSAFVFTPGKVSFADMLRDIKSGLVIENLMGAEQGNILGGDFSGNVLLGYRVENGKIIGRVKNTMVSGNVYQLLQRIAAVGSESRWVGSYLNTPPLYLPGISVAGK